MLHSLRVILSPQVFGKQVSSILGAGHLQQLEVAGSGAVLEPKARNPKVAHAPGPTTTAYADRRLGIRVNTKR